jgi:hypothetical protein
VCVRRFAVKVEGGGSVFEGRCCVQKDVVLSGVVSCEFDSGVKRVNLYTHIVFPHRPLICVTVVL